MAFRVPFGTGPDWFCGVCVCVYVCACGTAQVQVEGQQQVDEEVRQLLCGVGGQAVLNHVQQEPQERAVEML